MKSDDYFAQWQRMKDHLLDAPLVQPSLFKAVNAKNTEKRVPSDSPKECPCSEKIAQGEEQTALLQKTVAACAQDMQNLRNDIDDWIATVEERIAAVVTRVLEIRDNVSAHPV